MKSRYLTSLTIALLSTGCNQYSTPAVESNSATTQSAASSANGVTNSSVNPLNNQADPRETTGSVGGSPGGTSSVQTVPSSSSGVH